MSNNSLNDLAKEHKLEQDHKRELDQKHKWALGAGLPTRGQPARRPAKPCTTSYSKAVRREVEFQQNKAAQVVRISRKHESRFDNDACTSDSSTEEDIKEASTAPEPDAGYTYSYDAPHGPGKGSQILGIALAKAVEKFETKAMEKLVKDEYEIVGNEKEDMRIGYATDDDDFELV